MNKIITLLVAVAAILTTNLAMARGCGPCGPGGGGCGPRPGWRPGPCAPCWGGGGGGWGRGGRNFWPAFAGGVAGAMVGNAIAGGGCYYGGGYVCGRPAYAYDTSVTVVSPSVPTTVVASPTVINAGAVVAPTVVQPTYTTVVQPTTTTVVQPTYVNPAPRAPIVSAGVNVLGVGAGVSVGGW